MNHLKYYLGSLIGISCIASLILGESHIWLGLTAFIALHIVNINTPTDYTHNDIAITWSTETHLYLRFFLTLSVFTSFALWLNTVEQSALTLSTYQLIGVTFSSLGICTLANLLVNRQLRPRITAIGTLFRTLATHFYFALSHVLGNALCNNFNIKSGEK